MARAFVNHPPLLLADEPTGNLDPETSVGIMQLLYRINRTGTTVVVATHDKAMVDRMRRRVIEVSKRPIVRDERAGGYAAGTIGGSRRDVAGEFRRDPARGPRGEVRLLPPRGAARPAPQRRAVLRGDGHGARHGARARRLHPGRAGHHRAANDVREKVLVDVYLTPTPRRPTSRACGASSNATPGVGSVEFISKAEASSASARPAAASSTTSWAATRCPTPSA